MLFGKYINKYYLRYALFFILGIIALIVVDFAQIYIPQYLGEIVNLFSVPELIDSHKDEIMQIIFMVLAIALTMCIGRMVWRLTLLHASQKIEASLRHEMFLKAERLSQRYYHENKVGTIMAWFTNDLETIEEFFGFGTVTLIDAIFLSTFVIIKMVRAEPVLSLISALPISLIIVWGLLAENYMGKKWEERQQAFDHLYDYSQENFTGIRVIKAFVKENVAIKKFAKVARKNKEVNIKYARISVLFDSLINLIICLIFGIILGVGGYFAYCYLNGNPVILFGSYEVKLDDGGLVAYTGYFDLLIWPMIALGQIIASHARAKTSLKRISRFLDEEEEIKDSIDATDLKDVQGQITFKDFSFIYPGSKNKELDNVNLVINAGESIGIVGKIGSGKTTLVNSLLRLYNIEENSIFIDGQDIMKSTIKSIRDAVSYVPQDNFLFSDKVRNNIAFYDENLPIEDIKKAAQFACVDEDIDGFAEGYETVSGERGVSLSGGQKQRISIARAAIRNAPILIFDDSVSAVDVKTEEQILKNIKEQRKGKTTLVVASRVSTVSHLDRIIVLNNGRLEAFDNHENLLKISPTYQRMVFLQTLEKEMEGGK